MPREESKVRLEEILENYSHKLRNTGSFPKLEGVRNGFLLKVSQGSKTMPTPGFSPSEMDCGRLASTTVREYTPIALSHPVCYSGSRELEASSSPALSSCIHRNKASVIRP